MSKVRQAEKAHVTCTEAVDAAGAGVAGVAGGKVKRITALRLSLAWRSNSTGGQVVGIQSRIAGATRRVVGVSSSSSSQSHSSGPAAVAVAAALLPRACARRQRMSSTVSFGRNWVVPRICGAPGASLVRQRKPSTTAMVELTGREGTQATRPQSTPSPEGGEPRLKGKGRERAASKCLL